MKTTAEHNSGFTTAPIKAVRALAAVAALSATVSAWANPNFAMPDPTGTHSGYSVLLGETGSNPVIPGFTNTYNFFDSVSTPQPGHWELEILNPAPSPQFFNVTFIYPGGTDNRSVGLGPSGGSLYLDIGYNDAPETGQYTLRLISDPSMATGIFVDTDAIEISYDNGIHGVGISPLYQGGGSGGGLNNYDPFSPSGMTFILEPVPEPGGLALFGLGLAAFAGYFRRRNRA